jgi:hypothetical protein
VICEAGIKLAACSAAELGLARCDGVDEVTDDDEMEVSNGKQAWRYDKT